VTEVELAKRLADVLDDAGIDFMPKDCHIAIFVFRSASGENPLRTGVMSQVPRDFLREWMRIWLNESYVIHPEVH
jgi:hypothetical protein